MNSFVCDYALPLHLTSEKQRNAREEEAHGNTFERKFVQEILHAFSDPGCKRPLTCIPNGHKRTPNFQFFCLSSPLPSPRWTLEPLRLIFKPFAPFHLKLNQRSSFTKRNKKKSCYKFLQISNSIISVSDSYIQIHWLFNIRVWYANPIIYSELPTIVNFKYSL